MAIMIPEKKMLQNRGNNNVKNVNFCGLILAKITP